MQQIIRTGQIRADISKDDRKASSDGLDDRIARMAMMSMGEVVCIAEGTHYEIRMPAWKDLTSENAGDFLVSRLFTDAVFNGDIRSIQTIINRIDGGLPKDTELSEYRTYFADCMDDVLSLGHKSQLKVLPTDSVMTALCKSLVDIATEDIYWDHEKGRKVKPSDTRKQQRDNAMRMILERVGGRRTLRQVESESEKVELTSWLKGFIE